MKIVKKTLKTLKNMKIDQKQTLLHGCTTSAGGDHPGKRSAFRPKIKRWYTHSEGGGKRKRAALRLKLVILW